MRGSALIVHCLTQAKNQPNPVSNTGRRQVLRPRENTRRKLTDESDFVTLQNRKTGLISIVSPELSQYRVPGTVPELSVSPELSPELIGVPGIDRIRQSNSNVIEQMLPNAVCHAAARTHRLRE